MTATYVARLKAGVSRRGLLAGLGALGLFGLVGCAAPSPGPGGSSGGKLRVGLLPIVDALPIYVAESEGLFKARGLDIELLLFASALERDAALQAGQLDVELNDLVSATLLNKDAGPHSDEVPVRVIRLAYRGNPTMPMMTIVASPTSAIKSPSDLRNVPIAISGNSVIEYSTDQMLAREGLAPGEIQKTEVTKIPVRTEMLAKGQVQAATLPEPFTSLALAQGARRILDDGQTGIGCSVITARREVVDRQAAQLKGFLAAYQQAVATIGAAPEKYRALFVDKAKIPDQLKATLAIPPFPGSEVPTREEVGAVARWAVAKGLVSRELDYDSMVSSALLPAVK